jgi:amino acid permease
MPVVLEKGGAIPGIIMLIIAGCGAWSLWGAALSRTCDALKRPRWLP